LIGEEGNAPFYDHDGGMFSCFVNTSSDELRTSRRAPHGDAAALEWKYHVSLGIYLAATQSPLFLHGPSTNRTICLFGFYGLLLAVADKLNG